MPRTKTAKSPKKTERKDPPSRTLRGRDALFAVANKDERRVYRWVAKNETALAHYEGLGYVPEEYRDDGPQPMGRSRLMAKSSDSSIIERMGHVLMSIEKEHADDIYKRGEFGDGGQKRADAIEDRILDRKGEDLMRGIGTDYVHFENSTTPAERLGG